MAHTGTVLVVKPFLLLATRAEDPAADGEHDAFLRFGGLRDDQLERRRLEQEPLGTVDLDAYSGIILGGSPYNVSDSEDVKSDAQRRVEAELLALLDEVVERDYPFLGACYGVGLIGRHQGAVVDRAHPEPVGPMTIDLTAAGRDDPLLGILPDTFEAFLGHKENVSSLPDGVPNLASSASCPVQAFRVGSNVYATQFHPELDIPGIQTRIDVYKNYGYFAPETAQDLKDAAARSHVVHPPRIVSRFVELYAVD
ncbi:glutamine amidotransferase [Aeromicrobium terrae]|uniref:Glutamine amidotransferase n=1 Tax=Aeromicrobium terrae TaxID=2498846 RepID=A0A5C8NFE5_9ACTN|nr:glutamine amidotransferase [Aeromicrobium terrae]TXL57248.1 glutamine amidotransferase [Aeromicrobium terrae]